MKILFFIATLLLGCKIKPPGKADNLKDDFIVGNTAVSLRLPVTADLTAGNTIANVYSLTISPVDSCNGTQITRLGAYSAQRISVTVKSQCSYEVFLKLGRGSGRLETVFYANNKAYELKKSSLKVSVMDISMSLDLQDGGKDNGFDKEVIGTPGSH